MQGYIGLNEVISPELLAESIQWVHRPQWHLYSYLQLQIWIGINRVKEYLGAAKPSFSAKNHVKTRCFRKTKLGSQLFCAVGVCFFCVFVSDSWFFYYFDGCFLYYLHCCFVSSFFDINFLCLYDFWYVVCVICGYLMCFHCFLLFLLLLYVLCVLLLCALFCCVLVVFWWLGLKIKDFTVLGF